MMTDNPDDNLGRGTCHRKDYPPKQKKREGGSKPNGADATAGTDHELDLGIWDAGDEDYSTIPPRGWLLSRRPPGATLRASMYSSEAASCSFPLKTLVTNCAGACMP